MNREYLFTGWLTYAHVHVHVHVYTCMYMYMYIHIPCKREYLIHFTRGTAHQLRRGREGEGEGEGERERGRGREGGGKSEKGSCFGCDILSSCATYMYMYIHYTPYLLWQLRDRKHVLHHR